LRAGVDACNRWSFTNRGDLDGQWQLIKTYDIASGKYVGEVVPEPEAYYGFGIISRFHRNTPLLACDVIGAGDEIMTVAWQSPEGALSVLIVNLSDQETEVQVEVANFGGGNFFTIPKRSSMLLVLR
jgi:hypothetical protein